MTNPTLNRQRPRPHASQSRLPEPTAGPHSGMTAPNHPPRRCICHASHYAPRPQPPSHHGHPHWPAATADLRAGEEPFEINVFHAVTALVCGLFNGVVRSACCRPSRLFARCTGVGACLRTRLPAHTHVCQLLVKLGGGGNSVGTGGNGGSGGVGSGGGGWHHSLCEPLLSRDTSLLGLFA